MPVNINSIDFEHIVNAFKKWKNNFTYYELYMGVRNLGYNYKEAVDILHILVDVLKIIEYNEDDEDDEDECGYRIVNFNKIIEQ